nr:thymidine kinase [Brevibacterium sp. UCMA 11754]
MRRVRRAKIAGVNVLVLSHSLDTRSDLSAITSHDGINIPAVPVGDVETLAELARAEDYELVAIDEAQFFGPDLVPTVFDLVERGAAVIVEGLCVTFDGGPFEPMPTFMAVAEDVLKLTAVCTICGRDAVFHQRVGTPGSASKPRN